jgi:L-serine deaminase
MYQYILDWRRRSYGGRVRGTVSGYISEKLKLTVGRAPIDPNFVLAIERNQQNQINGVGDAVTNGASGISTIVDEYQQLALYDVFKGIVSNLIAEDNKMQE